MPVPLLSGRVRRLAVALCAVTLWLPTPTASAAQGPVTPEDVYRALDIRENPTDVILLVDVSASMRENGRYALMRSLITDVLARRRQFDRVVLITIGASPRILFAGPVTDPDAVLATLPATPTDRFTDIGAALEIAVHALEELGSADFARLIMLTDGQHRPAPGSRYPFAVGASWSALTARADAAVSVKTSVTGIAVPLSPTGGGGFNLVSVFHFAQISPTADPAEISRVLEGADNDDRAQNAKVVIGNDVGRAVDVAWTPPATLSTGASQATVTITSPAVAAPLRLSRMRVAGAGDLTARLPQPELVLEPGQTVTLPVDLEWTPSVSRLVPWSSVALHERLTLSAVVDSPWSAAFTWGAFPGRDPALAGIAGPASWAVGGDATVSGRTIVINPAPWGVIAALLGLLILLMWRAMLRRRRTHGWLVAKPVDSTGLYGVMDLRGSRLAFTASLGVPGRGAIRAVYTGRDRRLEVSYAPGDDAARQLTGSCAPDGKLVIHGVEFRWLPERGNAADGTVATSGATDPATSPGPAGTTTTPPEGDAP